MKSGVGWSDGHCHLELSDTRYMYLQYVSVSNSLLTSVLKHIIWKIGLKMVGVHRHSTFQISKRVESLLIKLNDKWNNTMYNVFSSYLFGSETKISMIYYLVFIGN